MSCSFAQCNTLTVSWFHSPSQKGKKSGIFKKGTDTTVSRTTLEMKSTDPKGTRSGILKKGTDLTVSRTALAMKSTDPKGKKSEILKKGTDLTVSRTALAMKSSDLKGTRSGILKKGTDLKGTKSGILKKGTDLKGTKSVILKKGTDLDLPTRTYPGTSGMAETAGLVDSEISLKFIASTMLHPLRPEMSQTQFKTESRLGLDRKTLTPTGSRLGVDRKILTPTGSRFGLDSKSLTQTGSRFGLDTKSLTQITEIMIGITQVVFSISLNFTESYIFAVLIGIPWWTGVLFIIAGSLVVDIINTANIHLKQAIIVMHIVSCIAAVVGTGVYFVTLNLMEPLTSSFYFLGPLMLVFFLLLLCFLECIIAFFVLFLHCSVLIQSVHARRSQLHFQSPR
ncbi:uncharacterized protein [Chiloscyllium punctatum]|uniref:uncharacterized protein n=1 Tax=Chiloscyllium punctatum TaxID=137246 RepID=UPI003B63A137